MSYFIIDVSKGLREPVAPGRIAYFFGAPLNSVNAAGWNALPTVTDALDTYDLSLISIEHEVCVAVLVAWALNAGSYNIHLRFSRTRDNKTLLEFDSPRNVAQGGWFYVYGNIGWTALEIIENGNYRVDFSVTGAETWSDNHEFVITGIPAAPPPPPPSGVPFDGFVDFFNNMAGAVDSIYLAVKDWGWPLNLVAPFFLALRVILNSIATGFATVGVWVDWVAGKLALILDLDTITLAFKEWIDKAVGAWEWVTDAVKNITDTVELWWLGALATVKDLIATAVEGLSALKAAWDNFWKVLFPNLVNFTWLGIWWTSRLTDIGTLIDSAFTLRKGLWEGWQDVKTNVVNFITAPFDWLWERFTDWFLGGEK